MTTKGGSTGGRMGKINRNNSVTKEERLPKAPRNNHYGLIAVNFSIHRFIIWYKNIGKHRQIPITNFQSPGDS